MKTILTLETTDAVIDTLGGTKRVAELVSEESGHPIRPQAVSNWRSRVRGKFPPETYLILMAALRREGERRKPKVSFMAAPSLWGITAPSHGAAA